MTFTYHFDDLINRDLIKYDVPTYCMFENNELDPEYNIKKQFYKVNGTDWDSAGFFDKEIFIHNLACKLFNEDFILPDYPKQHLIDDYNSISSGEYFFDNDKLRLIPATNVPHHNGRSIQEQFYNFEDIASFNWWSYRQFWGKIKLLYKAMEKYANRDGGFDRVSMVRNISSYRNLVGPRFRPPGFYCALFEKLNLKHKRIHDTSPGSWAKAIASTKTSMYYSFSDKNYIDCSDKYNDFIDNDLKSIGNTEFASMDDVECDVLMCDGDFNVNSIDNPFLDRLGKQWNMVINLEDSAEGEYIEVVLPVVRRQKAYLRIYK